MSDASSNPAKPTDEWVTGDEPLTGPQNSYLHTLAQQAGREVPDGLTKAEASELIDELQQATGRGTPEPQAEAGTSERSAAGVADNGEIVPEPSARGDELRQAAQEHPAERKGPDAEEHG